MKMPAVLLTIVALLTLSSQKIASDTPTSTVSTVDDQIREIREAIAAQGASWSAGKTSVSELPRVEKLRLTGLVMEEPTEAIGPPTPLPEFPDRLDWRDVGGSDWITPIKYQGICGACVSFGSIGPLEALLGIASGDPYWERDLSEQHLFSCGGGRCNWGWNVSSSMSYLHEYGVPAEECFPYLSEDGNQRNCDLTCFNADEHVIRIKDWQFVANNVMAMKYFLLEGPITTCMTVYEDFFHYTGGVYEHVWGDYVYGHCITLIGWDDEQECWICKNSWGIFWGEDGFFKIKYHDSNIGYSSAKMELFPTVRLMLDRERVSPGQTVICGVGLYNSGSDFEGELRAVLEVPWQDEFEFFSVNLTVHEGMNYTEPFFDTLTVPDLPAGVYAVYLDLRDTVNEVTVSFDMKTLIIE
ncbi:MAG: C1 family peptidase [Candidatus Glassbacteria bacterium]